jgi:hypothetical protein
LNSRRHPKFLDGFLHHPAPTMEPPMRGVDLVVPKGQFIALMGETRKIST